MNESDLHEIHAQPLLACLGEASRFRLVKALAEADRCVGELAEAVGLSQSCTTRHLQALERVGLVRGCREGRRVRFRLRAEVPGLSELLGWALSGAELEAPVAGREYPWNQCAPALAGLPSLPAPTKVARPARSTGAMRLQGKTVSVPMSAPESRGPTVPLDLEDSDSQAVAGSIPARRTNDLEDYLL
jgi:DNA-binding transcriptional ArsR family regulator